MFSIDIIVFQCVITMWKRENMIFHYSFATWNHESIFFQSLKEWKQDERRKAHKSFTQSTVLFRQLSSSFTGSDHAISPPSKWYARNLLLQRYCFHLKAYKKCCVILTIKIHIYLLYPCYTFAIATVITPLSLRYHSDILPRDDRSSQKQPILL